MKTGVIQKPQHKLHRYIRRKLRPTLARSETPFNWQTDPEVITQKLQKIGFSDATGKMLPQWAKDQQQSDSCGGQAGSYLLGILYALTHNVPYIPLSAKSIYSLIFYPKGGGATDVSLQKQLENAGAMTESAVPSIVNGVCTEALMEDKSWDVQPDSILMAKFAGYTLVNVENDVNAIAEAIRDYGAVLWHIDSDFYDDMNWLSANPTPTPTSPEGHFMCGYNAQVKAIDTILFAQSWGPKAGDSGTQYFTESTFIGSPDIVEIFALVPTYVPHPTIPGQQILNPAIQITWQTRLYNYFNALFSGWIS